MQQKPLSAPLLCPVLAWCLGIGLAKFIQLPLWPLLGFAAALLAAAAMFKRLRIYLVLLLCIVLGTLRMGASQKPSALDIVFKTKSHVQQNSEFLVTKLLSREANIYEIRLDKLAGVNVREPLTLFCESELTPGQSYSALLEVIEGKRDPILDTFPARHRAYIRQGPAKLDRPVRFLPIATWRVKLLKDLDRKLGTDAEFAKALLFSDTSAKGMYRDKLTRSGMIHLIVVSGLHIWFIYAMCMVLLNALLPRRLAEFAFMLIILLYAALNHWSPPVLRSILMIGLMLIARWRSIPLGGAQLLSLSLLAITAVDPAQLFDIGLQLSFLCVGVIMLCIPRFTWIRETALPSDRLRGQINRLLDLLLMNLVVSLSILPLTLYYFGTGSLNGILGNLLGVPLSGVLLTVCFIVLFVPAGNWLSGAYIAAYRILLLLFNQWTTLVSRLPFYLENHWISATQLAGSLFIVLALLFMLKRLKFRWQTLPAIALGSVLIFLPTLKPRAAGGIYLFNCGTGDCIYASFPGGSNLMVDTGPFYRNAESSWAVKKLLPWLKRKHIDEIDWMVLTHLDTDHSGGFEDIARAVGIRHLAVTDETIRDSRWKNWCQDGLLKGVDVICISDTVSYLHGDAHLKFLHPDKNFHPGTSNSSSIVMRLDHRGESYLFTGDADIESEAYLLSRYPSELKAGYLKAGHHGSRSSSSQEFVRAVMPREVWITASERNQWGFPHSEPLNAFRRYAKRILSTSEGTIYHPFAQND
jgi:competence protein ComEC